LPSNFVVTLPKVTAPEQVEVLAELFDRLEPELGIDRGRLKLELMVEAPQALIGPRGDVILPRLVEAAAGRCVAAHFGAYDYTAACGITAAHQSLSHPACDFARDHMQVSLAGRGVMLSDGATNVLPVPIHRQIAGGSQLSQAQRGENMEAVHQAWRAHYEDVRRSLSRGFYQGWDLHPGQLVTRYAANHSFFLEGLAASAERLKSFVERAARATLAGTVFDDAATGQGLLNYFLRAVGCGAVSEAEAEALTGLTAAEVRGRSFSSIVEGRSAGKG
jgi:malate synthase